MGLNDKVGFDGGSRARVLAGHPLRRTRMDKRLYKYCMMQAGPIRICKPDDA